MICPLCYNHHQGECLKGSTVRLITPEMVAQTLRNIPALTRGNFLLDIASALADREQGYTASLFRKMGMAYNGEIPC